MFQSEKAVYYKFLVSFIKIFTYKEAKLIGTDKI